MSQPEMSQSGAYHLPMDPHIAEILEENNHRPIRNVADYIERVNQYVSMGATTVSVYRGEPKRYEKPCVPNLYRDNLLKDNKFFEKAFLTPCAKPG